MGNQRGGGACLWLALVFATSVAGAAQAWSGEAGIGYDNNIANIRDGGDTRGEAFAQLAVGTDSLWPLSPDVALLWRLQLQAEQFDQHRELSSVQPLLQMRGLFRPGAGFHAPLLEAVASVAWWEFDSRLRDRAQYRFGLLVSEQLTTDVGLRVGWRVTERRARSAVFDTGQRSLTVDLDWLLQPALTVYLGYQHLDGDLVSTASAVPANARASDPDDAFAGETAFRLASRAHVATLGCNFALSPKLALDLQAREVRARADDGPRYERRQWLASLLWRY